MGQSALDRPAWSKPSSGHPSRRLRAVKPNRSLCESVNPASAEVSGPVPGPRSTRRLQDLIRPPQFAGPRARARRSARLPIAVVPGRCPESTSAFCTQLRKTLGVDAQPMADLFIEPRAFPGPARSSKTIATARSRSSAGCGFRDAMSPNFPRGHGLQGTRGGPLSLPAVVSWDHVQTYRTSGSRSRSCRRCTLSRQKRTFRGMIAR